MLVGPIRPVLRRRICSLVVLGLAVLASACDDVGELADGGAPPLEEPEAPAPVDETCDGRTEARIGPSGGIVATTCRDLVLDIPSGALPQEETISIERSTGDEVTFTFGPEGTEFLRPPTVSLVEASPQKVSRRRVFQRRDGPANDRNEMLGIWIPADARGGDGSTGRVRSQRRQGTLLRHFSAYAVEPAPGVLPSCAEIDEEAPECRRDAATLTGRWRIVGVCPPGPGDAVEVAGCPVPEVGGLGEGSLTLGEDGAFDWPAWHGRFNFHYAGPATCSGVVPVCGILGGDPFNWRCVRSGNECDCALNDEEFDLPSLDGTWEADGERLRLGTDDGMLSLGVCVTDPGGPDAPRILTLTAPNDDFYRIMLISE